MWPLVTVWWCGRRKATPNNRTVTRPTESWRIITEQRYTGPLYFSNRSRSQYKTRIQRYLAICHAVGIAWVQARQPFQNLNSPFLEVLVNKIPIL